MRLLCSLLAGIVGLAFWAGAARADTQARSTPSPLRLIPAEADLLLEVKDPTRLADLVRHLDLLTQVRALPIVKEQLDSTQVRRLGQLLAYVEKTLGNKWPALLDRLAGGGIALGVKVGSGNAPFVLVVQGKDEKLTEKFLKLAIATAEDELARQESKEKVSKGESMGVTCYQVGKDLHIARVGAALVLSNKKEALARALNLHAGKEKKSLATHAPVAAADKLLPESPLFRAWLNMAPIHNSQAGKDLYKSPRDNFALTILFGEYLDLLGRSPFLCAGLYEKKDGVLFTIRSPRGRDGMGPDGDLRVPPKDQPTSRPLLDPKGVLYSASFYLDMARIWKDRTKLFPKMQADGLTKGDKDASNFLAGGIRPSTILQAAGAYHRIVVTTQPKPGYKKVPQQGIPAFAFITEMRQPDKFARSMDAILRGGALLATNQFSMTLEEETHNGYEIVGYRFDEKAALKEDVNDIRFNFSPCYVRVENQFVFCSTIELCRELVDLLIAEKKQPPASNKAKALERFYADGFAGLVEKFKDQLITQTILDQAVPPAEAKEQVQSLIKLVRKLGVLNTTVEFGDNTTRYDFRLRTGK